MRVLLEIASPCNRRRDSCVHGQSFLFISRRGRLRTRAGGGYLGGVREVLASLFCSKSTFYRVILVEIVILV